MTLLHGLLEGSEGSAAYQVCENRGLLLAHDIVAVIDPQGKLLEKISLADFRESPGSGF